MRHGTSRQAARQNARTGAALVALALALVLPAGAAARPGDGLKVGPGRLKLGAEVEGRYDSQVGAGEYGITNGGGVISPGDAVGKLRGTFLLDVPGQNVRVNLSGGVDWNHYVGLLVNTSALSYLGANVVGGVNFNPTGRVGLEITESFSRSDKTNNPVFGLGVLGMQNATRARLRIRPGGGAIETGLSYGFGANIYSPQANPANGLGSGICPSNDACNPDLAAAYNAVDHRFGADAKWRFLPKTGLTLEGSYGLRSYYYGTRYTPNEPATNVKALLGFGTLVTTRLSFNVKGGYQGLWFQGRPADDVDSWLGQLELGFRMTETFQLRGGFVRGYEPVGASYLYFSSNRLYSELRAQFARLVLTALGSVDVIGFGNNRDDFAVTLNGRAEYHMSDWLRLTGGVAFSSRISNAVETEVSQFTYNRWEISAGVATLF